MLSEADPAFPDREIVVLVRDLLARRQEVVDGMVDRIQREIAFYRADTVDRRRRPGPRAGQLLPPGDR